MDEALNHLDKVSRFGPSASILFLVLAASFAITAIHTYQEWKGAGAPLWRNFGAIVGLDVPDFWGFLGFTFFLTLMLWGLATVGMAGWPRLTGPVSTSCAAAALGAIIGARLSDTLISHVFLHSVGYRPNPGLSSTPLYVVDALFVAFAFQPGLAADPTSAIKGLAAGVLFFVLVLPSLWFARFIIPSWRRARWLRWQPMPAWASKRK